MGDNSLYAAESWSFLRFFMLANVIMCCLKVVFVNVVLGCNCLRLAYNYVRGEVLSMRGCDILMCLGKTNDEYDSAASTKLL